MKDQATHEEQGQQHSNLMDSPIQATSMGTSAASPPPLQLTASSLSDLVSPVAAMAAQGTMQLTSLNDYNDSEADHDPSHLSDAIIKATDEYTDLMHSHYLIPTTDPSILYTPAEILLACRLMLRAMREGTRITVAANGREYLDYARAQIGSSDAAEALDGELNWNPTYPGRSNTDFGAWLLDGGPVPDASTGVMNCWELVMFSAYRAGYATEAGLRRVYQAFAHDLANIDVNTSIANFETALRRGDEYVYDPSNADSPKPLEGDIVIFNNLGAHVAVATGGSNAAGEVEIMSLWTQNSRSVYRTTIEELLRSASGPIRFYSPNWR